MFVRLAQLQNGKIDGQIDALRQQHERGRDHISAISEGLDGYAAEQPIATSRVIENLAAYIAQLRNHIHREDHIFFPMVEDVLSEEDQEQLLEKFEKARERTGDSFFEDSHKAVVDMGSSWFTCDGPWDHPPGAQSERSPCRRYLRDGTITLPSTYPL